MNSKNGMVPSWRNSSQEDTRARNKETPFLDSLNTGLRRQENVRIPLNIMGDMVLPSESHAFTKEKLATKH